MKNLNDTFWGRVTILVLWMILICSVIYGVKQASAADGEKIFNNKCKACHSFEKNKLGPHLRGLITEDGFGGRDIASVEGYRYSKAMLEFKGFEWDEVNLGIWLQNPRKMIPKTKMIFAGIKKEKELDALIEYLKTKQ